MAVDFQRCPHLHDASVAHDAHALAHGHGFDLIMGDVNDGFAELVVNLNELGAHGCAQLGVQIG